MKIYHLCPSGKVWILDQREVSSRKKGEALFKILSDPGDCLKIDIPGQDTIKIYNLLKPNNTMGNKKSQLGIHAKDQAKDIKREQESYNERAPKFFEEYTALTEKYNLFLNAQLEFSVDGVKPKIVVQVKHKEDIVLNKEPEKKETEEKKDEEPAAEEVAA